MVRTISIETFSRSPHQLAMSFRADDLVFTASHWYPEVNFYELERRFGRAFMEKVYFHVVIFDFSKLVNLRPELIDLGPFEPMHTRAFEALWRAIFRGSWAQWRYESGLPNYEGPRFVSAPRETAPRAIRIEPGGVQVLNFVGGGKDGLVAMRLLEATGTPFSTYVCSHSKIGSASSQHRLIDLVNDHFAPAQRHRHYAYDDFLDSPVRGEAAKAGEIEFEFPETIMSIFQSLPILLAFGYTCIVLGNERSASVANLVWHRTGEEVNHQWAKSFEAERLFDQYIRAELFSNASHFSILRPIHDTLIFNLLSEAEAAAADISSCNVEKPWCYVCAKCAYVWLCLMAYLPVDLVDEMFGSRNLFDQPENQRWYRQLLGLEAQTPFECVGEVLECRLAFELCARKGLSGLAIDMYENEVGSGAGFGETLDRYLSIDAQNHLIPPWFAAELLGDMRASSESARGRIEQALSDKRPDKSAKSPVAESGVR